MSFFAERMPAEHIRVVVPSAARSLGEAGEVYSMRLLRRALATASDLVWTWSFS